MTRSALIAFLLGVTCVAAVASYAARTPGRPTSTMGDGGITNFYDAGQYGLLDPYIPHNRCSAALGGEQWGLACSGWGYWNQTRVWKKDGDWIRVGFWHRDSSGQLAMAANHYDSTWNGQQIGVTRAQVGASPYNVATCAYDGVNGGASSHVLCDVIDW